MIILSQINYISKSITSENIDLFPFPSDFTAKLIMCIYGHLVLIASADLTCKALMTTVIYRDNTENVRGRK